MAVEQNLSKLVFNRLSNEKYHELKTSGKLDNEEFYITPDLDTNPGLIQDYISNAIIKIPQHINLELDNGTLTVKAGSKVYDGAGNTINIMGDIVLSSNYWSGNDDVLLFYRNSSLTVMALSRCSSGSSAPNSPSNFDFWYDTTNKIVKRYNGSSWDEGYSLPLAQIHANNNQVTSIDQVFNGIGYIGAVAFALPGIQAIIPNGFNKDSKLNNYTAVVERVLTKDYAADGLLGHNIALTLTNSPLLSAGNMIYVEEENQMYKDSISELNKRTEIEIAKITTDSTKITSLTPQPVYNCILSNTQVYAITNTTVHKEGNETITGTKIFTQPITVDTNPINFIAQNSKIEKGVTPSTNLYSGYDVRGKDGARLLWFGVAYGSSGIKRVELQKQDVNLTELNFEPWLTKIATPAAGANGTEAVNASWTNTKLNTKANLASPAFSGTPTVPTPSVATNNTQAINTQWINQKFQVVNTLPANPDPNIFYFVTNA